MLCMFGHPERAAAFFYEVKRKQRIHREDSEEEEKRRAPRGDSKWSKCLLMRKSASLKEEWIIRVVLDSFQLVYRLKIKSVRPFVWVFFSSLRTKCVLFFQSLNALIQTDWNSTRISVPNQGEQQGGHLTVLIRDADDLPLSVIHPEEDFLPCQSIRLALYPFQFFIPLLISFLFCVLVNVSSRLWGFLTNHHERLSGILPHFLWVDTKETR